MNSVQGEAGGIVAVIVWLALVVFFIVVGWKIFAKAGKPGWAAIVPIYNIVVVLEIVNRPIWWIILTLIPVVNFVVGIIIAIDLAKSFGKGTGFGVGLILLGPIFAAILAFGSAQYQGISRV
jgi:hypothetical protein